MNHINKVYIVAMLMAGAFFMSSCSPKMVPVRQLRSVTNKIEKKGDKFSLNDWEKAKDKWLNANKSIIEHRKEYSIQEFIEIGKLNARAATGFGKSVVGNSGEVVKGIGDIFNGINLNETVKDIDLNNLFLGGEQDD